MTARRITLAALAALCAVQIALPARQILRWETVLARGEAFRFRTAPVDPADALRGRYVALAFETGTVAVPAADGERFEPGDRACGTITVDSDGFARISAISRGVPSAPHVALRVGWQYDGGHRVVLPFDRYYLPEDVAPAAERAYRELARADRVDAFVVVRVLDGDAAIEALYLGGVPVREYLRGTRGR